MGSKKARLAEIVGTENVYDDADMLQTYAVDQSFVEGKVPDFVIFTETTEQIQQVVRTANETGTPLTPYSSGLNLHGAAIPQRGGIILNLSRMNRILSVDEKNWFAIVEPGVTFEQLQNHLMDKGYRIMIPFGAPPNRSALTSYLERDPMLAGASFEYGNNLIMDMEMVLPGGEVFRTGLWSAGGEPGSAMGPVRHLIYRLWTGAQGTLGIITKMGIQIHPCIKERKIFFLEFNELGDAVEPIQRIQRKEIGVECFLVNRLNLAALLSAEWEIPDGFPAKPTSSKSFEENRTTLSPWILVVCIHGSPRHPEEKIAYEEAALKEVCAGFGLVPGEGITHAQGVLDVFQHELTHPWGILKKFNYRGTVHDLSFKAPLKSIVNMKSIVERTCSKVGYGFNEVGAYLLPLERGRAVHCEFDLHCNLDDDIEVKMIKDAWRTASEALLAAGACFDRPYGAWADMVYQRSGTYTKKLRQVKEQMDPNNIMNPGKLCFQ